MDAGRAGVTEAQGRLGEMLVEFGVVESEASRLVAASGVHVALGEPGGPPGHALFNNHHERLVMHGHRLIQGVEQALSWTGPSALGTQFARGKLPDPELVTRLLTPRRLLDVLMRRTRTTKGAGGVRSPECQ
ncbi:MAG: hypothetical protein ACRDRP_16165 [Pseudonocardiaceae bacterium]